MKLPMNLFRLLVSTLVLSTVFLLASLAQQPSGSTTPKPTPAPKEYPKERIAGLVHDWTRARDYTKEYLDTMPEDGMNFKPTPEMRTFAEQMLHLAIVNYAYGAGATGQPYPLAGSAKNVPLTGPTIEKWMEERKTKAALTKAVIESYDFIINGLQALNEAKLDEPKMFAGVRWPVHAYLQLGFEHQTHQRALTAVYLRLKGVKPPAGKFF